ncbi:ATP-binding cassette domain-containing protein, partial [Vibrio parahaemolyticus]|nr:ATP-binding cassette domain-containing protein [Vibrio parahaemolyticus]
MNSTLDSQQADDAVVVAGLKMGYGDKILLENTSFNVKRGEILVILGGSGCGKSSLMKHIIGLYTP